MAGGPPSIKVLPLGAGQDVGRSCILVTLGGHNILFDCGMHMGYSDDRRFPDFRLISRSGDLTRTISLVVVSHFHLDHCGALPFLTEMCGYDGPIVMTHPTRAICPVLLEDFRRIAAKATSGSKSYNNSNNNSSSSNNNYNNKNRGGKDASFFTADMIHTSMAKVTPVDIGERVVFPGGIVVTAHRAGHVLGAAMFHIECNGSSVLYTGDFNKSPDRHLDPAWVDRWRPDLLITETTYATTIRDSKRAREREFLEKLRQCVSRGGKVLVPVFALGRAQEIMLLIETYWRRMGIRAKVYFAAGMAQRANSFYKRFLNWTNEAVRGTFSSTQRNQFEFEHIGTFDRSLLDSREPMVVLASPGMLHAGTSLEIFRRWAPDQRNLVVIPGWCVPGTVGHSILTGAKSVEIDGRTVPVRCQVANLSFSAHADARGIVEVIRTALPRSVVLVHGDPAKMAFMKSLITAELGLPCYAPKNGETISMESAGSVPVSISEDVLKRARETALPNDDDNNSRGYDDDDDNNNSSSSKNVISPVKSVPLDAVLLMRHSGEASIVAPDDKEVLDLSHRVHMRATVSVKDGANTILAAFRKAFADEFVFEGDSSSSSPAFKSVTATPNADNENSFDVSWLSQDDRYAQRLLQVL